MARKQQNEYAEIILSCIEEKYFKDEIVLDDHCFVRIISGEMKVIQADCSYSFGAGDTLLFPRNQLSTVIKYPKDGRPYTSLLITLKSDRLKEYYTHNSFTPTLEYTQKIRTFEPNPLLESFFTSLLPYFEVTNELPEKMMAVKVEEALTILRALDKNIDNLLADFSEPGKINLAEFMENNYMFNMPIEKFAYLTGRSLTTYKRDFKKSFHTTPQKWLTQKRLELAHYQLTGRNKKPADIYLEVGFENLSHFSFAFKKQFGYSPNTLINKY